MKEASCYTFIQDQVVVEEHSMWDRAGCGPLNDCCNLPWFYKQLPQATTDSIEIRVCRDQGTL